MSILDYEVNYMFMPELGVRVGRYNGAFGKQNNMGDTNLSLVDRSLANEVFNIGRTTGVELVGALGPEEYKSYYRAGIYNGFRDDGSTTFSQFDNNPAFAARWAMPLMGATPKDFENESDLEQHQNPVAQIGASYAYLNARHEGNWENAGAGTFGENNYPIVARGADGKSNVFDFGGEVNMLGVDAAVKYQGLSVIGEGFYQHYNNNQFFVHDTHFGVVRDTIDPVTGEVIDVSGDNYGWYTQAGYFLVPKSFELVARIGGVCIDDTRSSQEYAGGWNWYLSKSQDLKLSMDLTYLDRLPISSAGANLDGIQNASLWLLRTQLQFAF
jgi:hypothetical protein